MNLLPSPTSSFQNSATGTNEYTLPVTAYFKHSMIVVFPQPFAPTIIVSGKQNSITCSSPSGLKERTPLMESFWMDAIVFGGGGAGARGEIN